MPPEPAKPCPDSRDYMCSLQPPPLIPPSEPTPAHALREAQQSVALAPSTPSEWVERIPCRVRSHGCICPRRWLLLLSFALRPNRVSEPWQAHSNPSRIPPAAHRLRRGRGLISLRASRGCGESGSSPSRPSSRPTLRVGSPPASLPVVALSFGGTMSLPPHTCLSPPVHLGAGSMAAGGEPWRRPPLLWPASASPSTPRVSR
jgi:hypothetical protein